MNPQAILARALKGAVAPHLAADVAALLVGRARVSKPINASAHLKLCAALGVDPMNGSPVEQRCIRHEVLWWLFAAALVLYRTGQDLDQRAAAHLAKVSPATVCRAENAEPLSINSLIARCRFMGRHPHEFLGVEVSRETPLKQERAA